jgi:short-chain fatty acids transporter
MLGNLFAAWSRTLERLFPHPFTLALLLTLITFVVALVSTPHSAHELVGFWGTGMWAFLQFAMQMALILVTGQALAEAPLVARALKSLSAAPKGMTSGVALVSFSAMIAAWLNWGFGLIVGAILARLVADELATRLGEDEVSRGLLGAAGYTGLAFWHGGISGSAPLAVAQAGHPMEELAGVVSLQHTVFSGRNLALSVALLILVPLFLMLVSHLKLAPTGQGVAERPKASQTVSGSLFEKALVWLIVAVAVYWWFAHRAGLGLNTVIFGFLFLGLAAHGAATPYAGALSRATAGISGIVLQFPFYAGIVGIAAKSGLIGLVSDQFVHASAAVEQATGFQPFLLFVFLSAGLCNLFVPSGGGQWVIQGPIVLTAAQQLNIDTGSTILAVAYGDQWTNLLQPFWALPLLSITGLKPAQLLSVTTLLLVWVGLIMMAGLAFF